MNSWKRRRLAVLAGGLLFVWGARAGTSTVTIDDASVTLENSRSGLLEFRLHRSGDLVEGPFVSGDVQIPLRRPSSSAAERR